MLLNHLAAIFFFASPLLYVGLWMVIDAAVLANLVKRLAGIPDAVVVRRMRTGMRIVGLALVLFAIVI